MNPSDFTQNVQNQYLGVYEYPPNMAQQPLPAKTNAGQVSIMQSDIDIYNQQPSKRVAKVGQWRTPPHIQYINPNSVHKAPQLNNMPELTRQIPYSTPNYPIFTIPQRNNFQQPPKEIIPSSFPVANSRPEWSNSLPMYSAQNESIPTFKRTSSQPMMYNNQKWPLSSSMPSQPPSVLPSLPMPGSLPDAPATKSVIDTPQLLEMYGKLQDEYLKKQKRLARNRAAARLRRLRKKTQVETMEMKIDHFKNAIKVINNYEWTDERKGIYQAINHIGGSFILTKKERDDEYAFLLSLWKSSLEHQSKYLSIYMSLLAACTPNEEKPLPPQVQSFKNALNLSPDQTKQILDLAPKINDLRKKVMISNYVLNLLSAPNNTLIMNPFIDQTNDLFNSVLSSVQIAELMNILNTNRDVVEQLPYQIPQPSDSLDDLPENLSFDFEPK